MLRYHLLKQKLLVREARCQGSSYDFSSGAEAGCQGTTTTAARVPGWETVRALAPSGLGGLGFLDVGLEEGFEVLAGYFFGQLAEALGGDGGVELDQAP